ncbi:hypothetical protein TSOC_015363, partial [Tetrabaena socialis]
ALTILSDIGECTWPTLLRYDMCSCGFTYRGPEYSIPPTRPRKGEWLPCLKDRREARYLTYNPISEYCRRAYRNPTQAAEFGSWQSPERMKRDGCLRTLADGRVVQQLLESDRRFREDTRHLVIVLVSDAFVVPADEHERSSTAWLMLVMNAPPEKRHLIAGNVKPPGQKEAEYSDPNHQLLVIVDGARTAAGGSSSSVVSVATSPPYCSSAEASSSSSMSSASSPDAPWVARPWNDAWCKPGDLISNS